jgi:hypothetical protein
MATIDVSHSAKLNELKGTCENIYIFGSIKWSWLAGSPAVYAFRAGKK